MFNSKTVALILVICSTLSFPQSIYIGCNTNTCVCVWTEVVWRGKNIISLSDLDGEKIVERHVVVYNDKIKIFLMLIKNIYNVIITYNDVYMKLSTEYISHYASVEQWKRKRYFAFFFFHESQLDYLWATPKWITYFFHNKIEDVGPSLTNESQWKFS